LFRPDHVAKEGEQQSPEMSDAMLVKWIHATDDNLVLQKGIQAGPARPALPKTAMCPLQVIDAAIFYTAFTFVLHSPLKIRNPKKGLACTTRTTTRAGPSKF
jgi:hypothetical protein